MSKTRTSRRRLASALWVAGLVAFVLALGAGAAYLFWPRTATFYTDGKRSWPARPGLGVRRVLWDKGEPLEPLGGLDDDYDPCLSADGQALYFTRGRAGGEADLYVCYRTVDGWTAPEPLAGVNTDADEICPAMGPDGATLYFYSNRPGGEGGYDLYLARHVEDHWTEPVNLGPAVNSPLNEYDPFVSPDGRWLLFASNRPGPDEAPREGAWPGTLREEAALYDYDIYLLDLSDEAASPQRLAGVNSPAHDGQPTVSSDGRWFYFASNREGGQGGYDLYRCRIGDTNNLAGFYAPENLGAPVNTAANELDPALSVEGFGLYFSSDRAEPDAYQIYYARSHEVFEVVRTERLALARILGRLSWPLVGLIVTFVGLALLLLALTKMHRKPGLLTSALIASIILHLVALSIFSIWELSIRIAELAEDELRFEVAVSVPSMAESELSLELRTALEEMERLDTAQFAAEKTETLQAPPEPAVAEPEVALARATPPPREIKVLRPEDPVAEMTEALRAETAPAPPPEFTPPEPTPEIEVREVRQRRPRELPPRPIAPAPRQPTPEVRPTPTPAPRPVERPVQIEPVAAPMTPAEPPTPQAAPAEPMVRLEMRRPEAVPTTAVPDAAPEAPAEAVRPVRAAAAPSTRPVEARPLASPRADVAAEPAVTVAAAKAAAPLTRTAPEPETVALPTVVPRAPTGGAVVVDEAPSARALVVAPADTFEPIAPAAGPEIARPRAAAVAGPREAAPDEVAFTAVPRAEGPVALEVAASLRGPATASAETFGIRAVGPTLVSETPAPAGAAPVARPPEAVARAPEAVTVALEAPPEAVTDVEAPARPTRVAAVPAATGPRQALAAPRAEAAETSIKRAAVPRAPVVGRYGVPGEETLLASAAVPGPNVASPVVGESVAAAVVPALATGDADVLAPPEPLPLKKMLTLRTTPNREAIIEELGGSPETERAVRQALAWLALHQSDDGRWDLDAFMENYKEKGKRADGGGQRKNQDIGVTGLAALAYLGAGHTHLPAKDTGRTTEFAPVVRKAIEWIVKGQKENGDLRRGGQMYGHAMATMVLAEAYTMTGDESLVHPIRKAVDFIMHAQRPNSGWRYEPQSDSDTSVVGWQIMALKSAEVAGFEVPPKVYRGAANWLDKVRKGKRGGLYEYQPGRKPSPAMTAEGFFVEQYLDFNPGSARSAESIMYVMEHLPHARGGKANYYYWYYATLALHQIGGDAWEEWNQHIQKTLVDAQRTDGPHKGSWDPRSEWGKHGGRVYTTAVAALTLEVYYRYLPFYDLRLGTPAREEGESGRR